MNSPRIQIQATDEMLIEHSRGGNLPAFEDLFERYAGTLLEYLYLMDREADHHGSLLIEAFLIFYRKLFKYAYRDHVATELFRSANLVLQREMARRPSTEGGGWGNLDLFDRSLLVLTRQYGMSMGAVSRILGQDTMKLMERINALEAEGYREIDWPICNHQFRDYLPELRSRLQAAGQEQQKKRWLMIIAFLILLLLALIGLMFFRAPEGQRAGVSARDGKAPDVRRSQEVGMPVLIQELQMDRSAWFRPQEGFAEEKLMFIPGRGKVLALDYELFQVPASVGILFRLKDIDLSRFSGFSVVLRGDEEQGISDGVFIEFREGGEAVWRQKISGLKNQWLVFQYPLNFRAPQGADSLVLLIDDQISGPARSGRVYIDQLLLNRKKA
ncbi:MAG: hypothetical protein HY714_03850 [Candidatus Omnitrophica bacterium]|nr:hypothetical protein [Candidatus Omnitrophota bacterium]